MTKSSVPFGPEGLFFNPSGRFILAIPSAGDFPEWAPARGPGRRDAPAAALFRVAFIPHGGAGITGLLAVEKFIEHRLRPGSRPLPALEVPAREHREETLFRRLAPRLCRHEAACAGDTGRKAVRGIIPGFGFAPVGLGDIGIVAVHGNLLLLLRG